MANYREPQWLLPNEKNLQYPDPKATQGSGLAADRHSLYSMDFSGASRIDLDDTNDSFEFTNTPFSVSIWVKGSSALNLGIICCSSRSVTYGWQIQATSANKVSFSAAQATNARTATSTTSLSDDEWIHVVGIFKPDAPANEHVEIWVNGTKEGTSGWASSPTLSYQTTPYKRIAFGYGANTGRRYVGQIDEVAIFSRDLSSSEISTLYNNGAPSNPMLLSGKPLAYYPLGEQARNPNSSNWRFPNEVLQSQLIYFDGNTDYINLDSAVNLGVNSTISFWYKTSSNNQGLVPFGGASGPYYYVVQWGSSVNKVYFRVGGTVQEFTGVTEIQDGNWHHYCITRTGADAELFVDGVSRDTLTGLPATTDTLIDVIGATSNGTSAINNSYLTQVAFWDSNQSANIANIYNYGAPQTSYTVTPTAWYKLDKTSTFTGLNPNWHSALDFQNTGEIEISSLSLSSEFSIGVWLNADSFTAGSALILGYNANNNYKIEFSGSTGVLIKNPTTNLTYSGASWNLNEWQYLLITRDSSDNLKIYRNGEYWGGGSHPGTFLFDRISGFNNSVRHFDGRLSNMAIWTQVISAEDVKYLYNGGTPQTNISFEPVSWWKLDNLTTGIQDSGSASNNGTNNGATEVTDSVAVDEWVFENTVQSQTPNWSSALDFDGSNQWVDCGIDSSIDTGDLSVAFWFYKDSGGPSIQYVFNSGSGSAKAGFAFAFSGLNLYAGRATRTHRGDTNSYINIGVTSENWHHLALTYDDTTKNFILYLDGQQVYTEVGVSNTNAASSEIIFGRISNVGNGYYNGKISNAAIYNTTLDLAAIQALYNNGQPETAISSSPVSWWKLDNTTTGIQDSVGSNNGTNNGATEIQTNVWTPRLNGESDTLPSTALVSSDLQFNSAYSSFSMNFDPGGPDYINLGDLSNIGVSNASAASVSLWFKKDGDGNYVLFELKEGSSKIALQSYLTNGLYIYINNISYNVSTTVTNGEWHNIMLVFDGSGATNADKLKLYFNGSNITGGTYSGTVPTSVGAFTSSMTSNLGRTPTTAYFDGRIDECSIFNKALNQAEVTSIYNNGYPKDITALAPVSWWRLGEDAYFNGTDFIIPNKISGAPNGTSDNMTATDLVADAPGSYAAGLGSSLALADRLGDAPLSTANSLSFNMTPENRISYPAGYTPIQVDNVYSMNFDGANDHILTTLDITSSTSFSISAWVYANSLGGYNGVASQYRAGNPSGSSSWFLETISSDMAFGIANGAGAPIYATKAFSTSTWHHVVGVWDGSQVEVYIDGVASGSPQSITAMNTATVNMAIGGIWNNGGTLVDNGMWNGKIDEVAIFDYALSARQIKQDIYNATTSGKTADLNNNSNLTAPIAWYRMGD